MGSRDSETTFVGGSRRQMVTALFDRYRRVVRGGGSQMVVLSAAPGVGKTRLLQELYAKMSDAQLEPAYWPPTLNTGRGPGGSALFQGRKQLVPRSMTIPAGAQLPWLWWGLSCQQRADGTLADATLESAPQIEAHAVSILARMRATEAASVGFDGSAAVIGLLGLLGVATGGVVGVGLAVGGAAKFGIDNWGMKERFGARRRSDKERSVEPASAGSIKRVKDLAKQVTTISQQVPVVLVLDDAHWADPVTTQLVELLLRDSSSRVFVVATIWPIAVGTPTRPANDAIVSPFASWYAEVSVDDDVATERWELLPLVATEVADLIRGAWPEASDDLCTVIAERCHYNPLLVSSVLESPRMRDLASRDVLSAQDLVDLPTRVDQVFRQYWDELPSDVQYVLTLAAMVGVHFPAAPVAQTAALQGIHDAVGALARGIDPYAWVRDVEGDIRAFVEPAFHEIARKEGEERLTEDERNNLRQAIVDAALALAGTNAPASTAETVGRKHVALALEGLASPAPAARTAMDLALRRVARMDWIGAADAAGYAIALTEEDGLEDGGAVQARCLRAIWTARSGDLTDRYIDDLTKYSFERNLYGTADGWAIEAAVVATNIERGYDDDAVFRAKMALSLGAPDGADEVGLMANQQEREIRAMLAGALVRCGRVDEAIVEYRSVIVALEHYPDLNHRERIGVRASYSDALQAVGEISSALAELRWVAAATAKAQGPESLDAVSVSLEYARVLESAGKLDEATDEFARQLPLLTYLLGASHPDTVKARADLGRVRESKRTSAVPTGVAANLQATDTARALANAESLVDRQAASLQANLEANLTPAFDRVSSVVSSSLGSQSIELLYAVVQGSTITSLVVLADGFPIYTDGRSARFREKKFGPGGRPYVGFKTAVPMYLATVGSKGELLGVDGNRFFDSSSMARVTGRSDDEIGRWRTDFLPSSIRVIDADLIPNVVEFRRMHSERFLRDSGWFSQIPDLSVGEISGRLGKYAWVSAGWPDDEDRMPNETAGYPVGICLRAPPNPISIGELKWKQLGDDRTRHINAALFLEIHVAFHHCETEDCHRHVKATLVHAVEIMGGMRSFIAKRSEPFSRERLVELRRTSRAGGWRLGFDPSLDEEAARLGRFGRSRRRRFW